MEQDRISCYGRSDRFYAYRSYGSRASGKEDLDIDPGFEKAVISRCAS